VMQKVQNDFDNSYAIKEVMKQAQQQANMMKDVVKNSGINQIIQSHKQVRDMVESLSRGPLQAQIEAIRSAVESIQSRGFIALPGPVSYQIERIIPAVEEEVVRQKDTEFTFLACRYHCQWV